MSLDNPRALRVANTEFFISLRPAFLRGSASARPLWNDATLRQKLVKRVQVIFFLRCHSQGLFVRLAAGALGGCWLEGNQVAGVSEQPGRAFISIHLVTTIEEGLIQFAPNILSATLSTQWKEEEDGCKWTPHCAQFRERERES